MRTAKFKEVLWGVANRHNQIPQLDGLDRTLAYQVAEAASIAYKLAWEFYDWPEAQKTEQWTVQTQAVTGYKWLPYVVGDNTLATIFGIFETDPRVTNAKSVPYREADDGIYFVSPPTAVWIVYRDEPPSFTSEEWTPSALYSLGDLVYDPTSGHCYKAIAAGPFSGQAVTQTSFWRQVPLMGILKTAMKEGAYAYLQGNEGQHGTASAVVAVMAEWLDHEWDRIETQGGRGSRLIRR